MSAMDPGDPRPSSVPDEGLTAERWVRTVVEHAPDVHTVVGPDGRILYDSPSVLRVLGYAQGELVGRSAFELVHPDDLTDALDLLVDTAAFPERVSSLTYRFRHKNGGWRLLESIGTAVMESGSVAVIVNSRDVTERIAVRPGEGRSAASKGHRRRGGSDVEAIQLEMLRRLARAAELRDDETGSHTRRVAELAAAIAGALPLDPDSGRTILHAAPLHDIGKIGVPDTILRKPGPLTASEMDIMRTHTALGGRILSGGESDLMRTAELIALHHHERWDGTGYPQGLRGTGIPLPARIVAVADFFDALTHDRPYRAALPAHAVVAEIRRGGGSHFDPRVVEAFLSLQVPETAGGETGRPAGKPIPSAAPPP